MEKLFAIAYYG